MGKPSKSHGPKSIDQCLRWCEGKVRTSDSCTNACMDHFGADHKVAKAKQASAAQPQSSWLGGLLGGSSAAKPAAPKSFFDEGVDTMPDVGDPHIGKVPGI
eukprot:TRINITY_DN52607_c0_g1_i1.p3 TRINITY_DN52607_c0_g1~~TRINITY_DN52607_c0_g1_i1.p3  ORF type:complete len:101 (+),score=16.55 TRINITY_DN52607_c0_g1_i1:118-420(+)